MPDNLDNLDNLDDLLARLAAQPVAARLEGLEARASQSVRASATPRFAGIAFVRSSF